MEKGITSSNRLSTERKAILKTQKEMAALFNITERQYRALEGGKSYGSICFWYKANKYFQKPVGYLLGWEDVA